MYIARTKIPIQRIAEQTGLNSAQTETGSAEFAPVLCARGLSLVGVVIVVRWPGLTQRGARSEVRCCGGTPWPMPRMPRPARRSSCLDSAHSVAPLPDLCGRAAAKIIDHRRALLPRLATCVTVLVRPLLTASIGLRVQMPPKKTSNRGAPKGSRNAAKKRPAAELEEPDEHDEQLQDEPMQDEQSVGVDANEPRETGAKNGSAQKERGLQS